MPMLHPRYVGNDVAVGRVLPPFQHRLPRCGHQDGAHTPPWRCCAWFGCRHRQPKLPQNASVVPLHARQWQWSGGLRANTVALLGWFGPRGLASVVFTLLAFVAFEEAGRSVTTLVAVATWTILLSVVVHGLTAQPLAAWYARRLEAAKGRPAELVEPRGPNVVEDAPPA